jgi:UDP-N-acetylglucosamine 2-epimerase (non-hydrolysing)
VIDALLMTAARDIPLPLDPATSRYLLVTAHRRENFGAPLEGICAALGELVERDPA